MTLQQLLTESGEFSDDFLRGPVSISAEDRSIPFYLRHSLRDKLQHVHQSINTALEPERLCVLLCESHFPTSLCLSAELALTEVYQQRRCHHTVGFGAIQSVPDMTMMIPEDLSPSTAIAGVKKFLLQCLFAEFEAFSAERFGGQGVKLLRIDPSGGIQGHHGARVVKFDTPEAILAEVANCDRLSARWLELGAAGDSVRDAFASVRDVGFHVQPGDFIGGVSLKEVLGVRSSDYVQGDLAGVWPQAIGSPSKLAGSIDIALGAVAALHSRIGRCTRGEKSLVEAYREDFRPSIMPEDERVDLRRLPAVATEIQRPGVHHYKITTVKLKAEFQQGVSLSITLKHCSASTPKRTVKWIVGVGPGEVIQSLTRLYDLGYQTDAVFRQREIQNIGVSHGHLERIRDAASSPWRAAGTDPLRLISNPAEQRLETVSLGDHGDRTLLNPLWFYEGLYGLSMSESADAAIRQACETEACWLSTNELHGDLNCGNLIISQTQAAQGPWPVRLIDFASMRSGPVDCDYGEFEADLKCRVLANELPNSVWKHGTAAQHVLGVAILFEEAIRNGFTFTPIRNYLREHAEDGARERLIESLRQGLEAVRQIRSCRNDIYQAAADDIEEFQPNALVGYEFAVFLDSITLIEKMIGLSCIWAMVSASFATSEVIRLCENANS